MLIVVFNERIKGRTMKVRRNRRSAQPRGGSVPLLRENKKESEGEREREGVCVPLTNSQQPINKGICVPLLPMKKICFEVKFLKNHVCMKNI